MKVQQKLFEILWQDVERGGAILYWAISGKNAQCLKMSKAKIFWIILGILILLGGGLILIKKGSGQISQQEKEKIEIWILENDLNEYGDPKGTFYTGGTPLFDEMTGKKIDKYEYILKKHPERPWKD